MDCKTIKEHLPDYVEGTLNDKERALVEKHIWDCDNCSAELEELKAYFKEMKVLEPVSPPADFLAQVRSRLDKEPGLKKFWRDIFFPFRLKVPVQLAATAVVALFVISFFYLRPGQRQDAAFKSIKEAKPVVSDTVSERAAYQSSELTAKKDLETPADELAILSQKKRPEGAFLGAEAPASEPRAEIDKVAVMEDEAEPEKEMISTKSIAGKGLPGAPEK